MIFYLAEMLRDYVGPLNAFTYQTVRAGGAALTGFVLCLLLGPTVIRWLQSLKIGQFIRKEHVADLHELHKGKSGTPTMGGALVIVATVLSLMLWARWDNRLLYVAVAVFVSLGAVGFLDDYIKLRRKHNDGLSARAKFTGQIFVGLILGIYLVVNPITVRETVLSIRDVHDWPALVRAFVEQHEGDADTAGKQVWERLDVSMQGHLRAAAERGLVSDGMRRGLVLELNRAIRGGSLFVAEAWAERPLAEEAYEFVARGEDKLDVGERERLNRLLVEASFPGALDSTAGNLHTQVEVPGFRRFLIPLGIFYALFVLIIIVASSNAVNLTDGLDGLAIGASIVSLLAYTAIAYIISRADWSDYLYLVYVPEAAELTVFGAALIGTGLGFLWYNSHPAEVFMGDTGSLGLGGALGTMAVLTKQELLLLIVGGLFVMEALSVIIQVGSYKLRGKRVFRMAPLHHHFELLGWSESKVTVRFWIISILFALMSLATLKLR
jgi:phospho-N-acetylmuramoyl-pentapeptide-transferase